jgi:hypothetical protein
MFIGEIPPEFPDGAGASFGGRVAKWLGAMRHQTTRIHVEDPVGAEVRAVHEALLAECGYGLHALCERLRTQEPNRGASEGLGLHQTDRDPVLHTRVRQDLGIPVNEYPVKIQCMRDPCVLVVTGEILSREPEADTVPRAH